MDDQTASADPQPANPAGGDAGAPTSGGGGSASGGGSESGDSGSASGGAGSANSFDWYVLKVQRRSFAGLSEMAWKSILAKRTMARSR